MKSFCLQLKSGEILSKRYMYLWNIEAVLLKLGTKNVHHKRNKITPSVLYILFVPLFCFIYSHHTQQDCGIKRDMNTKRPRLTLLTSITFHAFHTFVVEGSRIEQKSNQGQTTQLPCMRL